jgi:tetratricopeptide (TPR) repeat protein/tRNA A-37 threonylcarbamoyl transferase component Bud32
VLGIAGHGGMGVVYRAYDPNLQREVALKLLRGRRANQSAAEARLRREAQAMARVSHPNVLPVYDVGIFEGRVFVAMEFLEGDTLADWLEHGTRSWRDVVALFVQAARGLAAAHRVGLVHRDFKPQNVIIGSDGRARVMDFGLARVAGPDSASHSGEDSHDSAAGLGDVATQLTAVGSVVGTPRYMAPEQHFAGEIDGRSDQFAFCVALYEALFRVRAFVGDNLVELAQRKYDGDLAHTGSADVPSRVRRAVMRGMAGRPEDRHASMDELVAELERDPPARTRRVALVGGAGLAVVGALVTAAVFVAGNRPCRDADRKLAGVWDDDRRVAVERSLTATGLPFAADTSALVRDDLDAYAKRWVEAHDSACAATKIYGEQSDDLLDLRMVCLERQRTELAALVELFANADVDVVEQAVLAAAALRDPVDCSNTEELLARVRPPDDPSAQQRIEWIEDRLARGTALQRAGKARAAIDVLEPVAAAARELAWRPLEADAVAALADALDGDGQIARARELSLEAFAAALAGNASRTAAQIATDVAFIDGHERGQAAEGHRWAAIARSLVEAIGGDPHLTIAIDNTEGITCVGEGDYARAQELVDGALARLRAIDPTSPRLAIVALNLGGVLAQRGQYASARRYLVDSLAMHEDQFGKRHPSVALVRNNLAAIDLFEGRYAAAIPELESIAADQTELLGSDHPELSNTLNNLANAYRLVDRIDDAIATHRRVLAIRERAFGPRSSQVAQTLDNLGVALRAAERLQEARQVTERSRDLRAETLPADHPDRAMSMLLVAEQLVAERELAAALPEYDRAIDLRERVLGRDHPLTLVAISARAKLHEDRGHAAAAIADCERLRAVRLRAAVRAGAPAGRPSEGRPARGVARGGRRWPPMPRRWAPRSC